MKKTNESTVEIAALEWLNEVGYATLHGEALADERAGLDQVVLAGRLRDALYRINDHIPAGVRRGVIDQAVRTALRPDSNNLLHNNRAFHLFLVDGIDVSYTQRGQTVYDKVWLLDYANWTRNDWLAVQQLTITDVNLTTQTRTKRIPDIVIFVNGLPLLVFELKNPTNENASLQHAFNQLQTYKADIPTLFHTNGMLIISDGTEARVGTLTSPMEWFKRWRSVDGEQLDPHPLQLETLIKGICTPHRLLDLLRYFVTFSVDGATVTKKLAQYHQYHAVNKAVDETVRASMAGGDQRVGIVWHTQGSGKSLSMLFYAGRVIQQPDMANPTLVILTDRNDLDDQLFSTFASGSDLLRQDPVQADSRDHLRELLTVAAGGVVFTTIQKFRPDGQANVYPLLSERRNIIFIADEAHRSQYGFAARLVKAKASSAAYLAYGFAKYVRDALPNASFIGFTGTPIESDDISTPQVFGNYIDVYDIGRAVADEATVPIWYESRLAKLKLKADKRPKLDADFEEITEGHEAAQVEQLKSRWSQLEAMVGTGERLGQIANDIVTHFEQRQSALDGKGMIVCMSRRICVDLYAAIVALRPAWHDPSDEAGAIKVVMTGAASDPAAFQPHVRNKTRRKALAERLKDPADPLKLVLVRDMWLTGFDAPPLHTMYIDKPMRGHGLMQAIARVNRVYSNKPGGLIVDYLGIAADLQAALNTYVIREGGGRIRPNSPMTPQLEAVRLMLTQYDIVQSFFIGQHQFDYDPFFSGTSAERLAVIPNAMEHLLQQQDGKSRFMDAVTRLSKAFALAIPHDKALAIRDTVAFFQAVRAAFAKHTQVSGKSSAEMDGAIKQLISAAVASDEVINIFEATGIQTPDVSILSDEFLADVAQMPQQHLALELLRKLLNDEIRQRMGKNAVQARSFAQMLESTLRRYQNRSIDSAQVLTELIAMSKELREADKQGEALGLTVAEYAFYSALSENDSAMDVLGNQELAVIATELVRMIRGSVTLDWTVKQSVRAQIRVRVKRILKRYGYPPDLQERAMLTVLEQAELLSAELA